MRVRGRGWYGALVSLVVVVPAADAYASSARVDVRTDVRGAPTRYRTVSYSASRGEQNRLVATFENGEWRFRDTGAEISPDRGCRAIDPHEVVCSIQDGVFTQPYIYLHDGDERVETPTASYLEAGEGDDVVIGASSVGNITRLGPGDDVFEGGAGTSRVDGGGGRDVMRGGGGNDYFEDGDHAGVVDADVMDGGAGRDGVSYGLRPQPVMVDLRRDGPGGAPGEGDDLRSLEGAAGGDSDDILIGDNGPNSLSGGRGGDNTIIGHGGRDSISGGAVSRDRIAGGRGSDYIELDGEEEFDIVHRLTDDVDCGGGPADEVVAPGELTRIPADCERLSWISEDVEMRLHRRRRPGSSIASVTGVECNNPGPCTRFFSASIPRYRGRRRPVPGVILGETRLRLSGDTKRRRFFLHLNARGERILARRRRLTVLLTLRTPRFVDWAPLVEFRAPR